jgi:hypothetical protein
LLFAQRLHSAAFKLRIPTECLGNYLVRFVSGWRQGKAPQKRVSKAQPIALREKENRSFNLLEGAHGSKTTALETAGKVRHDFGSGVCPLPSAVGTKTRARKTGITRPLLQLLAPRMFLLKSQTLRQPPPGLRLAGRNQRLTDVSQHKEQEPGEGGLEA